MDVVIKFILTVFLLYIYIKLKTKFKQIDGFAKGGEHGTIARHKTEKKLGKEDQTNKPSYTHSRTTKETKMYIRIKEAQKPTNQKPKWETKVANK